jgi:hypothetical protein
MTPCSKMNSSLLPTPAGVYIKTWVGACKIWIKALILLTCKHKYITLCYQLHKYAFVLKVHTTTAYYSDILYFIIGKIFQHILNSILRLWTEHTQALKWNGSSVWWIKILPNSSAQFLLSKKSRTFNFRNLVYKLSKVSIKLFCSQKICLLANLIR